MGFLTEGEAKTPAAEVKEAWRSYGWIEGQNLFIERRFARRRDELPGLAAQIVAAKPDLVVAEGTPAAVAMKRATSTIPVLFVVSADPVEAGLVESLARPGGNLTGFFFGMYDAKVLQLIKEIVPGARVVVYPVRVGEMVRAAAQTLGMTAHGIVVAGEPDLRRFYEELRARRADAVVLPPMAWDRPGVLAGIAAEFFAMKMPAIGPGREFVESGGLISFGPKPNMEGTVMLLDRLLRGANPAEIAVQFPTRFDLVINLRTAKAFGLTISQALLHRADDTVR